jgi:hypothetical protein
VKAVTNYKSIWTSKNSGTRTKLSIWEPVVDVGVFHRNKCRICVGHYPNDSFDSPAKLSGANTRMLMEVRTPASNVVMFTAISGLTCNLHFPPPYACRSPTRHATTSREVRCSTSWWPRSVRIQSVTGRFVSCLRNLIVVGDGDEQPFGCRSGASTMGRSRHCTSGSRCRRVTNLLPWGCWPRKARSLPESRRCTVW